MKDFKEPLFKVFTKYVQIESGSEEDTNLSPSTPVQFEFAKVLKQDLEALGLKDIILTQHCHITATLPSNVTHKTPVIGFIAHMDTFPGGTKGRTVKPQLHKNYQGGDIKVSDDIIIKPKMSPALNNCIGHDIVTASGDTLLGADDKAGISIIMVMLEHLIKHPEIKHGEVKIAFTPDEEIGFGTKHFDKDNFKADFAFTLDGECGDGIVAETFNAYAATIKVKGVMAHTGMAKDVMENPVRILSDIISSWPESKLPETTCKKEDFICFTALNADLEKASAKAIIRSFSEEGIKQQSELLKAIVAEKQLKYPNSKIELTFTPQYKNMRQVLDKHPHIIKLAQDALKEEGLNTNIESVRGGTDGANLSFMGIPTPNLDAGYSLPHGPFEWTSLDAMAKILRGVIRIVENNAKQAEK